MNRTPRRPLHLRGNSLAQLTISALTLSCGLGSGPSSDSSRFEYVVASQGGKATTIVGDSAGWAINGCSDDNSVCWFDTELNAQHMSSGHLVQTLLWIRWSGAPVNDSARLAVGTYPYDDTWQVYAQTFTTTSPPTLIAHQAVEGTFTILKNRGDTLSASFAVRAIRMFDVTDTDTVSIHGFFTLLSHQWWNPYP